MQKKYKIGLIIITILIVLITFIDVLKVFVFNSNETTPHNSTKIILNLKDFGYTLDNRDSSLMQAEFETLMTNLKSSEINYEEYAESLSKLFIIDFYTLDNKINKYDVGGLEYILSDKKEMFQNKAMDTIYKDIIDNTYNDRKQSLPIISNVNILETTEDQITLNDTPTDCYKVKLEFSYEKDLGYDTKATIYLVRNNEKLEIALYKPTIED